MKQVNFIVSLILSLLWISQTTKANVKLNSLFCDHMVLQRNIENPVWGTADAGEKITISIDSQNYNTKADKDGKWKIKLKPMKAGGPFTMVVSGKNKIEVNDILIGEVWVCSGQSNMQFGVSGIYNADVEIACANYPEIRLLNVEQKGSPELQSDIEGKWQTCSAETVSEFSAVGYLFGKRIHQALGVPVGLIHNSWGGTPIQAFIPRDVMEANPACKNMLVSSDKRIEAFTIESLEIAQKEYDKWVKDGKPGAFKYPPTDPRYNNKRPANLFNGMVHPLLGYGIRGAIWYQGEANKFDPGLYQSLFPMMITSWRERWGQGDFPFYWVQLADHFPEDQQPEDSNWAKLREAQTMTLSLPNTGQAVISDLGEADNIHPQDKQTVADRLVRHALVNDYGFNMVASSPGFKSMEIQNNKIVISFNNIDKGLYAFDTKEVKGFAIAGKDGKYVWAEAKIIDKNKVEVYSKDVLEPLHVSYGWASNPVANLYDKNGLPVAAFKTDFEKNESAKK